ncbi:MAG: threonylcarbamoyl-AMP synthase [bacterium]|nr:threonylcarbamoyl-AMP synthase [Candidatus Kapabacteria bacterium]
METRILDALKNTADAAAIAEATTLLLRGELVAFPTETVYGLGAIATDATAIQRVYEVKGRPISNPLIVHVGDVDDIRLIAEVDDRVRLLAERFMPGPLTLVLKALDVVPTIARAGLDTVAVRIPDHPVALRLLNASGPLVGPSANLSGRPSPTTAQHVIADLDGLLAAVIDGGPCRVGIESTVVDLTGASPVILRPGEIEAAAIAEALGVPVSTSIAGERSPGTRFRHYAPTVPVRLVIGHDVPTVEAGVRLVLTTTKHLARFSRSVTRVLSSENFYAQLRNADEAGFLEVIIYIEPDELPHGLLDRVMRASGAQ